MPRLLNLKESSINLQMRKNDICILETQIRKKSPENVHSFNIKVLLNTKFLTYLNSYVLFCAISMN